MSDGVGELDRPRLRVIVVDDHPMWRGALETVDAAATGHPKRSASRRELIDVVRRANHRTGLGDGDDEAAADEQLHDGRR
jgi:hypothetical protein